MILKGYLEGYYGRLLSWNDRSMLLEKLSALGMDFYIYGPKEDPYHRIKWSESYPDETLNYFKTFHNKALKEGIRPYFSLSPGLTYGKNKENDLKNIIAKIKQLKDIGFTDFAIFFDDINFEKNRNLGLQHGDLLNQVNNFLLKSDDNSLIFCPTVYCDRFSQVKLKDSPYLKGLSESIPSDMPMLWTGREVVSKTICNSDIETLRNVINNPVIIWDNYYANDYCPNNFFVGPHMGRSVTDKTILGLGINPTGLPLTDSIILSQVDGTESTGTILNHYEVPDEFTQLLPFFSSPFVSEMYPKSLKEIKAIKELFIPLCIEWKSHLQLEWAPFLWNFFNDLNLFLQIKEGKNKKKLEAWASQRYSNLIFETIFSESDKGE